MWLEGRNPRVPLPVYEDLIGEQVKQARQTLYSGVKLRIGDI